jgi:hypothetical protein
MSDPDRNPQHRRGHNWFSERTKKPPRDVSALQRRPEVQYGAASTASSIQGDRPNIAQRHDSRAAEKTFGPHKSTWGIGHSKCAPCHKRRQAPSFKLVKIGRKLLDPGPRP